MSFDNIIGNENEKVLLNKTISSNNVLHSYLFLGIEGIGKSLFAKEFAKMLLCNENKENCDTCKSCIEFEKNNHPDFMMIENEEKVIKIEQIRYMRTKNFRKANYIKKKSIYYK